jgi:hypothetical protein
VAFAAGSAGICTTTSSASESKFVPTDVVSLAAARLTVAVWPVEDAVQELDAVSAVKTSLPV